MWIHMGEMCVCTVNATVTECGCGVCVDLVG